MSRIRSGGILLVLAVPFALYILWQVQAGARADFAAPAAPPEKAPTDPKQLAATKSKAEKWAGDVRQTVAVVLQYRVPGPEDKADDPDCNAIAKAAAARGVDLTDLEKFLSGVDRPTYAGALKERYAEWQVNKLKLAKSEEAIEAWLRSPLPVVDTQTAAVQTLKSFDALIADYRKDSTFADSAKATAWQIEARVKVLESLEAAAHRPYDEVLALTLPLPNPRTNKVVEKALGLPVAIREQVRLLEAELARVEAAKRVLPEPVTKAANSMIRRADEWAAKEQLLLLFADPEIFTDPSKAAEWLPRVQAQFNKTQTQSGRELIRKKMQQFCEAYIPKAARLDANVLVRDKEIPRINVTVVYKPDGSPAVERPLSTHPSTLNEFNFTVLHKDFDQIRWAGGIAGKDSLKPTPASVVARDFTAARATVTVWTPETLDQLKKKCEGDVATVQQRRREQLDGLSGAEVVRDPLGKEPPSTWTRENTRIWARLTALSEAMKAAPGLFEAGK
ncbi:MAG: hypothetical protein C0467_02115 [Planctomycetaceae bacterium]|nr:hypothetical protein [Planctomycetaceae bacterium]